ncbi:MAG TPA: thiosulfate sulfurtransferase GlpE [Gammaproteobacteria bacterium]|jgi:thiosulfate sulfurtransferase|nr:thiosulfate sulfurtransferase GlpE [Gammaproteobacteria bacterium]MDC0413720.1 thiosulfate sulfurtransferase GlpE [Gammaproteobacteria bacterium]HAS49576.1 thiosulfate sulfurtransferase GlpE [Gammaproteobacteria bacterium]
MEFKRIDVHQARAMLEEASESGLQLVDIRDERSFSNGRISSALHLDNSGVQPFIENADPSKPLIVYCYHGNMSQSAAAYFSEQGFEDTYSMDGGFSDWEVNFSDKIEVD